MREDSFALSHVHWAEAELYVFRLASHWPMSEDVLELLIPQPIPPDCCHHLTAAHCTWGARICTGQASTYRLVPSPVIILSDLSRLTMCILYCTQFGLVWFGVVPVSSHPHPTPVPNPLSPIRSFKFAELALALFLMAVFQDARIAVTSYHIQLNFLNPVKFHTLW